MRDKSLTKEEEIAGEEAFERRFFGCDEAVDHDRQVAYFEGASDREANADMTDLPPHPVADQPATARQIRYLQAVAREAGMDAAALDERALIEFGFTPDQLSRRDVSTLIDLIQMKGILPME